MQYQSPLSDKIWWTRKSRIEASERLKRARRHSEIILLWYSFLAVASSIYLLTQQSESAFISTTSATIYSVLVLCMSVYINGANLPEKAFRMEQSYKALDDLYDRARTAESSDTISDLVQVTTEYRHEVKASPNHSEIDYFSAILKLTINKEAHNKKLTVFMLLSYACAKLAIAAFLLLIYTAPLFVLLIAQTK